MKQQTVKKILIFSSILLFASAYLTGKSLAAEPMSTQEMEATLVDNSQTRTLGWWETWQNKTNKKQELPAASYTNNVQLPNQYESWTEQTTYQRSMEQINDLSRENRITFINRPINTVQPK